MTMLSAAASWLLRMLLPTDDAHPSHPIATACAKIFIFLKWLFLMFSNLKINSDLTFLCLL